MTPRIGRLQTQLVQFSLGPPTKLANAVAILVRRYGRSPNFSTRDAREAALAVLRLDTIPKTLTSLQRRGLIGLGLDSTAPEILQQRAIDALAERHSLLPLGDLLALWQLGGEFTPRFSNALGERVIVQLARRPHRIPAWMQELGAQGIQTTGDHPEVPKTGLRSGRKRSQATTTMSFEKMVHDTRLLRAAAAATASDASAISKAALAFSNPAPQLLSWIIRNRIPPHLLKDGVDGLGVTTTLGIGAEAITDAIRHGPVEWWELSRLDEILDWAGGGTLIDPPRGAERLLLEASEKHKDLRSVHEALKETDSSLKRLRRWVITHLRRPDEVNGQWNGIDERARAFMERMLVLDVFERILEEFRRQGDAQRADFWLDYVNELRDAALVTAGDVAVCIMAFNKVLAIEFGTIGNAAYLYALTRDHLKLSSLPKHPDMVAADFKSRDALRLWRHSRPLAFLDRIVHIGAWEDKASAQLARLGVHI